MTMSTPVRRTVSAALATLALGAPAALTPVAASAAPGQPPGGPTGWIRAAHLAPGTPEADVSLTSFSSGKDLELSGVGYGEVSEYNRMPVGLYTIELTAPGGAEPMVSRSVRVTEDAAITVAATGKDPQVQTRVVYDDLTPPPAGQARVRLLSGVSPTANDGQAVVDATIVGGPPLAEDVAPGTATGYAEVEAQTWTIELTGSTGARPAVADIPVRAGGVYTLLALESGDGGLRLKPVVDSSGSGVMPAGGVDTGAGGLARHGDGSAARSPALYPVGLASGVLLGAVAVLVVARRGGRSTR